MRLGIRKKIDTKIMPTSNGAKTISIRKAKRPIELPGTVPLYVPVNVLKAPKIAIKMIGINAESFRMGRVNKRPNLTGSFCKLEAELLVKEKIFSETEFKSSAATAKIMSFRSLSVMYKFLNDSFPGSKIGSLLIA
jgi:hypothetical protein